MKVSGWEITKGFLSPVTAKKHTKRHPNKTPSSQSSPPSRGVVGTVVSSPKSVANYPLPNFIRRDARVDRKKRKKKTKRKCRPREGVTGKVNRVSSAPPFVWQA